MSTTVASGRAATTAVSSPLTSSSSTSSSSLAASTADEEASSVPSSFASLEDRVPVSHVAFRETEMYLRGTMTGGINVFELAGRMGPEWCSNDGRRTIFTTLAAMYLAVPWPVVNELAVGTSVTRTRRHVLGCLDAMINVLPLAHSADAMADELTLMPEAAFLIDCFPVRCRGPSTFYNGKNKCKVLKYQVVTTLRGQLVSVRGVSEVLDIDGVEGGQTMSDLRLFDRAKNEMHADTNLELYPGAFILGDKAYVTSKEPLLIAPIKPNENILKKMSLTNAVCLDKYLQLVRSPVERCFSRLHKWGVIRFMPYGIPVANKMVRAVAGLDTWKYPQPPSRFMGDRASRAFVAQRRDDLRLAVAKRVTDEVVSRAMDLRGDASTNRAENASAKKTWRYDAGSIDKMVATMSDGTDFKQQDGFEEEEYAAQPPPPPAEGFGDARGRSRGARGRGRGAGRGRGRAA